MAAFGRRKNAQSGGAYQPRLSEIGGQLNRARAGAEDRHQHRVPLEYFDGPLGDLLRSAGIQPDSPENVLSELAAPADLIEDNRRELEQAMSAAPLELEFAVAPYMLLPEDLWRTDVGWFLAKQLDLLPYRPWNTIMLPVDNAGIAATGLPAISTVRKSEMDSRMLVAIGEVKKVFLGSQDALWDESNRLFDRVAAKFPALFPNDDLVFTEDQMLARKRIRAIAFFYGGQLIGRDTIMTSQTIFLGDPANQLIA